MGLTTEEVLKRTPQIDNGIIAHLRFKNARLEKLTDGQIWSLYLLERPLIRNTIFEDARLTFDRQIFKHEK